MTTYKIQDKDISIIVQGPILKNGIFGTTHTITKAVCARVKKVFPNSELILSTRETDNTEGIIYDKLVLNYDPGAVWFDLDDPNFTNNCNRLIVSTREGIKAATRKYVLKLRSDLFIISKSFLNHFYQFPYFDTKYKFIKNRIIAFPLDTIKGHLASPFFQNRPYHISDWAYFGYKEDLWDLFDIPLTQEPAFSHHFLNRPRHFFDIHPARLWKMPPEQYITVSFLQKHIPIKFEHMSDISNNNIELSEKLLTNNFLVLDQTQFALFSLKYAKLQLLFPPLLSKTAIFFHTWLKDYYTYCNVPQKAKKFSWNIQIKWRKFRFNVLNSILTTLNNRTNIVQRFVCFWVNMWCRKNNS